jgi:DNA-binding transcriptional regulator YdaS (Cro superfamily)
MRKTHPIKVQLARLGETQTAFAPRVGVSPQVLNQILNGRVEPWPSFRSRAARVLELSEEDLFPELASK